MRALLQGALNIQESDQPKEALSKEELVKQMHRGGRKKSLAWAYENPFPTVHRTDGGEASEEELQALLLVDGIARKFKFKQVKAAAGEALGFAAAELGITREELSDRIVPDLGFDKNMERVFDYGERIFKVMLTPALDIEVYDESGKKLKNLPAPGKKDDADKAAAAYADFKEMKKQMKAARAV